MRDPFRQKKYSANKPSVGSYIIAALACLYVLAPFYILIITSLMTEQEGNLSEFHVWPTQGFSLLGYKEVFEVHAGVNIFKSFGNTLWIYVPGIIVGLYMSAMSAFSFAKLEFKTKKFMFSVLMFTLMLPNTLYLIAQVLIFDTLGWMGTPLPLMIPPMFGNISAVFFLRQYYLTIPNDLIDQAKIDGLTPFGIFNRIMIKISIPSILTQFILMFMSAYNDYMGALLFAQSDKYYTLQVALQMLVGAYVQNWPARMAGCVVAMTPLIIMYMCSQKLLSKGMAITSGLKGQFMKKKSILSLVSLTLLLSGCTQNGSGPIPVPKGTLLLSTFTHNSMFDPYDSSKFYRNDLDVCCGDAGCIYVSPEEDPVWGGYYYLYQSGNDNMYYQTYDDHASSIIVMRSRDLNDWETCGAVDGGFCCYFDTSKEWISGATWAPEAIRDPVTGKYFIYFNASSKVNPDYVDFRDKTNRDQYARYHYEGVTGNSWDRFYIYIGISDSPIGPFRCATSETYYGDATIPNLNGEIINEINPAIDIKYHWNTGELFGIIDASPFFDDDGTFYLYFAQHVSSSSNEVRSWGMRMKDMITPDYETLTLLASPNYKTTIKSSEWDEYKWSAERGYIRQGEYGTNHDTGKLDAEGYKYDGNGNEGPYVRKVDDNRYLLMYSARGYSDKFYDTSQCYGDNPLGPFMKPPLRPSAVVGANDENDFMTGTGHSTMVPSPDGKEMYCIYWTQGDPLNTSNCAWKGPDNQGTGRLYAFDRIFVVDTEYGKLFYGNGPTKSLQPKMSYYSGVSNIAGDASVRITNLAEGEEYINDGLFVSHEYYKGWETTVNKSTKITLTFDEPREVSSVMVYNSYDYKYAFSEVDAIDFVLSEKPSWTSRSEKITKAHINKIEFSDEFINPDGYMRQGGSCLASFNPIMVKSLTISISKKISNDNNQIKISDIVVLGK